MNLRDYLAAAALTGLLQKPDIEGVTIAAEKAYAMADAMLAEREREA